MCLKFSTNGNDFNVCLPILTAENCEIAALSGGDVCGTLTVVSYYDRTLLVTANHVLRTWGHTYLFSPLLEGRKYMGINGRWMQVSDEGYKDDPDGLFDLAYLLLSADECALIDNNIVQPMIKAKCIMKPFNTIMMGFREKNNRRQDIARRGEIRPDIFEIESKGLEPDPDTMKLNPIVDIPFNRKTAKAWNGKRFVRNYAPVPRGVSGGPVIYLEKSINTHRNASSKSVVGFLIEQRDQSLLTSFTGGSITVVLADVLICAANLDNNYSVATDFNRSPS